MGEVVVSSDGGMELQVQETEVDRGLSQQSKKKIIKTKRGAAGSSSVVKWERFLPKMAVRVLLVEADDSTRQIIAALLRKCSYRVAAVSDGLQAWEVLKGRSHNIDLILTEVELPSISGYPLLTLIMEHHICKHIPVIMMSCHESVSTVYKCMLRGAADFLVKPVRKNELRNLWQHVWRKQAMSLAEGPRPPDESVAQQEVETTAENNSVSDDHMSGYMVCLLRNRGYIEKESDGQSSCTKPELEAEGADIKYSRPENGKYISSHIHIHGKEECHHEGSKKQPCDHRSGESGTKTKLDDEYITTLAQDKNSSHGAWERVNGIYKNSDNNKMLENPSREAIDLVGAFDNYLKGECRSFASNANGSKCDITPALNLSLRRSNLSGSVNQVNDENQRLNHSDASAFSMYRNKTLQPSMSNSPSTCNQRKDQETNSEKRQSNHIPGYTSDSHAPALTSEKFVSVANTQYLPIPIQHTSFNNVINSYGSALPVFYSSQPSLSPLPSSCSAHHSDPFPQLYSFYRHSPISKKIHNAVVQTDNRKGQLLENQGHCYPAKDQIGNIIFCNGNVNQHHNPYSANNGKINSISSECANEKPYNVYERAPHKSTQREAALTKFRLKRKERCFEKKVRYESRKKLAEQRPRVKGQFVRQVTNDTNQEKSPDD